MTHHSPVQRGWRLLVVALCCLLSLGAAPWAHADPSPDPKLNQKVSANEKNSDEPTEVGKGHVDVGTRFVNGTFTVMGRDDTVSPQVWRTLDSLVLRVNDQGLLTMPDDPAFAFLGIEKGKKVHVIPQTQLPKVLWLGWNTQDPEVTRALGRGADLVYLRHQGPGELHVFITNGFEAPLPLWDSRKPAGQKIWMDNNTHVHANWVFTEPGVHLVEVEVQATDARTKQPLRAKGTLRFAVGDAVTTEAARQAWWQGEPRTTASVSPSASASPSASTPSATAPTQTSSSEPSASEPTASAPASSVPANATPDAPMEPRSSPLPWLLGVGAVVVVAAAAALVLHQRKLRRQAWTEDGDE